MSNLILPAIIFLAIVSIWELVWKGIALWRAGRNNHLGWFIAILILNTMGLLPILYIFIFSKPKKQPKKAPKKSAKKPAKKAKK